MKFLAPDALWLLLSLPVLACGYLALLGRRRRGVRYASIGLVREAITPAHRLRPHLPAIVLCSALALTVIAIARPATTIATPSNQRTIILAMDVSTSMAVQDVGPSRLAAAQAAAKAFIASQPPDVRIGIVAFAGHADLIQSPSTEHGDAMAAIDGLHLQHSTSIGTGLIAALLTLFPHETFAGDLDLFGTGRSPARTTALAGDLQAGARRRSEELRAPGSHPSAAIILLTDGRDTMGPRALKAAHLAAERGVRVYTVGVGRGGATPENGRYRQDTSIDEDTLKQVATLTRGEYFHASTAKDLHRIYLRLNGRVTLTTVKAEITALASAIAVILSIVAGVLSLLWCNRSLEPLAAVLPRSPRSGARWRILGT
jgi:Ca-activated chloride channel family protein